MNQDRLRISAQESRIPLRHAFKHASAERRVSESIIAVAVRGKMTGIGEGCPRAYVTGETIRSSLDWIQTITGEIEANIASPSDLNSWVTANSDRIDKNPAAWCAMEIALLDLFARESNVSLEEIAGAPPVHGRRFRYTAVLGDDPIPKFCRNVVKYLAGGFSDFKMKIGGDDRDLEKVKYFKNLTRVFLRRGATLRVDANNLWNTGANAGIKHLSRFTIPLVGVEEPLQPRAARAMSLMSMELNIPIILDESLCGKKDVELFEGLPGAWIGNIRVSKMGGVLRSLEMVRELKRRDWKIIVGAQVGESSILTRAALPVAAAAGDHLAGQEGAFGTWLLSYDPVQPVLMFGWRGGLRLPSTGRTPGGGLGLTMRLPRNSV